MKEPEPVLSACSIRKDRCSWSSRRLASGPPSFVPFPDMDFAAAGDHPKRGGLFGLILPDKKRRSRGPGNRTQVSDLVDAVQCENGFVVQFLFPDTYSAQLVTDSSYLCFSTYHSNDATLAGDTIKRCITGVFGFVKNRKVRPPALPVVAHSRSLHKIYHVLNGNTPVCSRSSKIPPAWAFFSG
jgi:hypothetical protein